MSGAALVEDVVGALSYLRIGELTPGTTWHRSTDLLAVESADGGQSHLAQLVRETGKGRGVERNDIAMSLFLQAYAFRIASAAISGWILTGGERFLDISPRNCSIALGRNRPNAVGFDIVGLGDKSIQEALFDDHLGPMVDACHAAANSAALTEGEPDDRGARRVGKKMLWGNVGAGVASTFGVFSAIVDQDPSKALTVPDAAKVRDLADRFFEDAPSQIQDSGRFVLFKGESAEPVWAWERSSCCLWYQVEPTDPTQQPTMCTDCSLWSDTERNARYLAATGANE